MAGSAPRLRVTIVTLDKHLAGAIERAEERLARDGIELGFHAASEWDRDPSALDRAKADIARGDIVLVTMLFLDEHIKAVLPALEARREACDAMVCLMSGAEVVRLTRMGAYRMDAPAKGPMALLKRLRGKSKPGSSSGAGQMRMLRRLPKLLRFIPGAAQDVRAYFLTLQYWLAGSDDNVAGMIRALADRYADGERRALRGALPAEPPRDYPEVGVYHPSLPQRLTEQAETLPRAGANGTVGLLMLRSYLLARDAGHYDGVIAALEARGLNVIPAFASGLDARPAIERFFAGKDQPAVDAIVNLTGFSMVGGPAYNDSEGAIATLAGLDVPYIAAQPLEFQSLEQWRASPQGLLPLEATMMVALPELDGAIAPSVFGGRSAEASGPLKAMTSCPERAGALAAKVAKLIALRRSSRTERKLAIVLFNFPPNAGATGTAAFLAVWESLHATLTRLAAEGYVVDVPADVDALRDAVLKGNAERYGADANVAARIPADEHVRREPHLAEIEAQWGPAPGRQQADGGAIQVLGAQFGNIFVGIQPAFGFEGDPMRLLFEAGFAPTHAFSAFYRWLREDFGAHSVLHFGTHGALEFMPGKQAGLSGACWPERLIGDLPNFYLYAANNPSEGLLAKRRGGATLLSYLTPPLAQAGLYKGLSELKALLERWRIAPADAGGERTELEALVRAKAEELDLQKAPPPAPPRNGGGESQTDSPPALAGGIGGGDSFFAVDALETLSARLYELETSLIPHGLHVLGSTPQGEARAQFIAAMPVENRETVAARLDANDELGALIHALDGTYVRPAPGGDLIANPDVLPTGRNLHGFDPFKLPSAYAVQQGRAAAERLIERHLDTGGTFPESLAMVLWGTDNLKSEGAQIAQALALIGARPRLDGYGRLCGAELVPLEELGRPRIDVIATLSGIFRDLLPLQTRMLAEAAWLASVADEPEHLNFVRKHSLAHMAAHACDMEVAALRVFSNAEGAYGANVNQLVDGGTWTDPDELAEVFERRKGFAYGRSGAPAQQRALLKSALAGVELTYQNLESIETGITDIDQYMDSLGGISRSVARARGEAAPVYIVDATRGDAKVRTLSEQVELETRTRTLNPLWYEGMLKHGAEGVRSIESHVATTLGWSATTGQVAPWIYQRIGETFVLDPEMRERLARLNPKASARMADRLLEACDRSYWQPDADTLAALHEATNDIEDRLEGLVAAE